MSIDTAPPSPTGRGRGGTGRGRGKQSDGHSPVGSPSHVSINTSDPAALEDVVQPLQLESPKRDNALLLSPPSAVSPKQTTTRNKPGFGSDVGLSSLLSDAGDSEIRGVCQCNLFDPDLGGLGVVHKVQMGGGSRSVSRASSHSRPASSPRVTRNGRY